MQALSILSLRGTLLDEFHLGYASFGCITSRRYILDYNIHYRRSFSLFAHHTRLNFDSGIGYSFKCCNFGHFLKVERRGSIGMCFPVGWTLEDKAIDNNDSVENSELYVKDTETGLRNQSVDESILGSGNVRREITNEGEVDEENVEKQVDVRNLGQLLSNAKSVYDVEEVMRDKGGLPLQVFSSIIRGFGREKKLEPALAVVDWLKKNSEGSEGVGPNLFIYNSLLGAVKQSGELDKVDIVLNAMDEAGISWNVVTYNTLMGIYLDEGRTVEALDLFEEITRRGLSPSPPSYSTVLLAYRNMEDGIGALNFFLDFKERYLSGEFRKDGHEDWDNEFFKLENFTSRICYQVMRRWLVKNGNFTTNVLKLLIEMDKAAIPPTREEYERLIWACTREEHCSAAKELYNRIRESYSDISLSVCNHIIWLMGNAKKWWAALEIYEDLLDKGPKPNNLSYELIMSHFNILLGAARKRGIWRWGLRLLNKMEAKGLKPRSKEWNAVLIACSKASEANVAVEVFKRMIERGEKPTVVSYGALLSALEKGKLYDEADRVWVHMRKVGVPPNLYAYTIMASVYVGLGKFPLVDYIIQEMESTGNNPTVVTFNAIISACLRNGMGGVAYEWFQRMKSMSIDPNEITYDTLIEALANDGKPRLAYELYLRALNEDLKPSSKAYDAIIQSSRTLGATIDINSLGPRPPEKNKKVLTGKNLTNVDDVPTSSESFVREQIYVQEAAKDLSS